MNFKELCELEPSKIIEESVKPINELYGQYKIRIQILDGDNVIDEQEHSIAGDEAVWNKYQQLNQQFVNESIINEEVLYENLEKMFGNLGVYIKDYFTRKQNPDLETMAPAGGLTKYSASDLANMIIHNINKFNPRLAVAVKTAKEHSKSPQEFLANVKGLAYNYQQYQESYVEERIMTQKERERINAIHLSNTEKNYNVTLKYGDYTSSQSIFAKKPILAIKKAIDNLARKHSHLPIEEITATVELYAW